MFLQRIRKIVVRTEPFPRTASGKIKVGRPQAPSNAQAVPKTIEDVDPNLVLREYERVAAVVGPVLGKAVAGVRRTLSPERWKWVVLVLGALAGFVVLWNIFGHTVIIQLDAESTVRRALESVEDRLAEVLAVLVLAAAVAVWRTGVFKSEKSNSKKENQK